MAEPNAAIMSQLAGFNEWNIDLTTLSSDNKALFDDELAANTTYRLHAVNIKDPLTQYTTASYNALQGAVTEMSAKLTTWANKKFGTAVGQIRINGYANAFHAIMPS